MLFPQCLSNWYRVFWKSRIRWCLGIAWEIVANMLITYCIGLSVQVPHAPVRLKTVKHKPVPKSCALYVVVDLKKDLTMVEMTLTSCWLLGTLISMVFLYATGFLYCHVVNLKEELDDHKRVLKHLGFLDQLVDIPLVRNPAATSSHWPTYSAMKTQKVWQ